MNKQTDNMFAGIVITGSLMLTVGIGCIHWQSGLITGGLLLLGFAWMARKTVL